MLRKHCFVLVIVLCVLVLVPACGGGGGKTEQTEVKPVKIGVIQSWSGPAAGAGSLGDFNLELVDWLIDKEGGILVGGERRPVQWIRYDDAGSVAQDAVGATKLILQDKVSVVIWGGITTAQLIGVASVTDPAKVLFATYGSDKTVATDIKWMISTIPFVEQKVDLVSQVVSELFKAKTVALIANDVIDGRYAMNLAKDLFKPLGIKVVSEQYIPFSVQDLSPYITKIKYGNPDVLITNITTGQYGTLFKQILELGGWGSMKTIAIPGGELNLRQLPGAQGTYSLTAYVEGSSDSPGARAFEEAIAGKMQDSGWAAKSKSLNPTETLFTAALSAVRAIEFAGTDDPAKIAEAARSGKLEFDTPMGHMRILPDGTNDLKSFLVQIVDGKAVRVAFARH